MIRFVLDRIWNQIDSTEYLNRSTTIKFVSASFKSCTINAEFTSMWPVYRFILNHTNFAYSHFAYSYFAYDLFHFAYSHFAYTRFAYTKDFDYSCFAYSSLQVKI